MFAIVAGSIVLILLLIVLVPWLKSYFCPELGIQYCIRRGKEVNVKQAFDEELRLDDQKIQVEKEIARFDKKKIRLYWFMLTLDFYSGSFGTIYRGSYKLANGGKYAIALKTIRLDVEKGREKDRERLELLKVFY